MLNRSAQTQVEHSRLLCEGRRPPCGQGGRRIPTGCARTPPGRAAVAVSGPTGPGDATGDRARDRGGGPPLPHARRPLPGKRGGSFRGDSLGGLGGIALPPPRADGVRLPSAPLDPSAPVGPPGRPTPARNPPGARRPPGAGGPITVDIADCFPSIHKQPLFDLLAGVASKDYHGTRIHKGDTLNTPAALCTCLPSGPAALFPAHSNGALLYRTGRRTCHC